jgi:hypothetical protein
MNSYTSQYAGTLGLLFIWAKKPSARQAVYNRVFGTKYIFEMFLTLNLFLHY